MKRFGALAGVLLATFVVTAVAWAADPGGLDRSFSGNGIVRSDLGAIDSAHAATIDARGRIVAAGTSETPFSRTPQSRFALARYNPHGGLDRSFSGDGKVHTSFSGNDYAIAEALAPGGRIVVAGTTCGTHKHSECDFALARYRRTGALDRSFGTGGKVTTDIDGGDDSANSVAIDSRGKIVVAGSTDDEFAVARYRRSGTLDPSFGTGGVVTTPTRGGANSVAIDSRGRIVAGGGEGAFRLARYKRNGRLDQSFGRRGIVTTHLDDFDVAKSIAIGGRGRIVASGYAEEGSGGDRRYRFAVARYRQDGSLDDSFSGNGKVKTTFSQFQDIANAVAIDSHGRVIAGGYATGYEFALARYHPDGRLDRSFGEDGKVRTPIDTFAVVYSLAIDAGDRIVAAGAIHKGFGLARYVG